MCVCVCDGGGERSKPMHIIVIKESLQPQNERCQLIKVHVSSGEIAGEHFQSGIFSTKVWYFI